MKAAMLRTAVSLAALASLSMAHATYTITYTAYCVNNLQPLIHVSQFVDDMGFGAVSLPEGVGKGDLEHKDIKPVYHYNFTVTPGSGDPPPTKMTFVDVTSFQVNIGWNLRQVPIAGPYATEDWTILFNGTQGNSYGPQAFPTTGPSIIGSVGPLFPTGGTSLQQTVTLTSAGNGRYVGSWENSGSLIPELINDADIHNVPMDSLKPSTCSSVTLFTITLSGVAVS